MKVFKSILTIVNLGVVNCFQFLSARLGSCYFQFHSPMLFLRRHIPELTFIRNRLLKLTSVISFALLLQTHLSVGAQVIFTQPMGGWRSAATGNDFAQKTNYPAASVNTQGIALKARITGQIAHLPKSTSSAPGKPVPAQLIVNGTEMPLKVNEGRFSRPWAFGPGSNSVEVKYQGQNRKLQFYESKSDKGSAKLRVILSWDADDTDVDLHIVSPDGQHAWYGEQIVANGGGIDVDVTTGYGPEIYSNPVPIRGTYLIFTNYYGGYSQKTVVMATVSVITEEGTSKEKREIFYVPLRKPGELQLVRSFQY